jgi:hypothetical protein
MNRGLVLILFGLAFGCNKPTEPSESSSTKSDTPVRVRSSVQVNLQDGLVYDKASGKLFSGLLRDVSASGQPLTEVYFKNGHRHGLSVEWRPDGSKSLEGQWSEGVPQGVVIQWAADGLLRKETTYGNNGQVVKSETIPTERLQGRVTAAVAQRETMDRTVWKGEIQAQEFEAAFVSLWDQLRVSENPWEVIKSFTFGEIRYADFGRAKKLSWNIKHSQTEGRLKPVEWKEWLKRVEQWEKTGWLLEESEWHQESFQPNPGSKPRSVFKAVVHLHHPGSNRRTIIRGKFGVSWDSNFKPAEIAVEQLRRLSREGQLPFQTKKILDLTVDDPHPEELRSQSGPSVFPAPLVVQDLNGDALPEIILGGSGLLYWNRGGGQFEKSQLIPGHPRRFKTGVLGDFNGDQQVDWFSLGADGTPVVFPGVKERSGFLSNPITSPEPQFAFPQCVGSGDVDGDGDLDVFVAQYKTPYGGGQMPTPYYDANDGFPAALLINNGHGEFTDGTIPAGLQAKRHRRTYSASFVDWDRDHDLDLIVISDFAGIDLYLNNGKGKFTDITSHLGRERYSFGMSHVLADFNGDGFLDIYMLGMGSTTARRLAGLGLGKKGFEHLNAAPDMGYGNRLLLGNAKERFGQAPYNDRLARTGWSWGCTPWDFDNDGDRDIYIANGMLSARSARDYCTTFWRHDIRDGASKETLLMQEVYNQCMKGLGKDISWNGYEHNAFLLNEGEGNYQSIGYLMGVGFEFDSRSVVGADLDLDGRTDLLIVQMDQLTNRHKTGRAEHYLHLVQNNMKTEGNWIGLHMDPGTNPVGALVTVRAGGKIQTLPVVTGDSYSAQHPLSFHFGLGKTQEVGELLVEKFGRKLFQIRKPDINRYHRTNP